MKYLIIFIFIVFIYILFRREGLYNKNNMKVNEYNPNPENIKDTGITTQELKDKSDKINNNIFSNKISSIYLDKITLLS